MIDVLGRLGEVRAQRHAPLHRLDHGRVGVTDDVDAVAAVHVDVLGAVDVPHVAAQRRGSTHTGTGRELAQLEGTPPGMRRSAALPQLRERSVMRAMNVASSRSISSSRR